MKAKRKRFTAEEKHRDQKRVDKDLAMTPIPLVGQTQAGSAEVHPARDNQPKATNGRWDGRQTPVIPFDQQKPFGALSCLKKPSCRRQEKSLTCKVVLSNSR